MLVESVCVVTTRTYVCDNTDGTVTVRECIQHDVNKPYMKSLSGMIRVLQFGFCFLAFNFTLQANCPDAKLGFFAFCTEAAFLTTLLFYLFHIYSITFKLSIVPWLLVETIEQALWSLLLVVAAPMTAAGVCNGSKASHVIGVILAFAALLAYLVGVITGVLSLRSGLSFTAGDEAPSTTTQVASVTSQSRTTTSNRRIEAAVENPRTIDPKVLSLYDPNSAWQSSA